MKILIVEDDEQYAKALQMAVRDWPVRWCRTMDAALKAMESKDPVSGSAGSAAS